MNKEFVSISKKGCCGIYSEDVPLNSHVSFWAGIYKGETGVILGEVGDRHIAWDTMVPCVQVRLDSGKVVEVPNDYLEIE